MEDGRVRVDLALAAEGEGLYIFGVAVRAHGTRWKVLGPTGEAFCSHQIISLFF
jgi:hypothetical protein